MATTKADPPVNDTTGVAPSQSGPPTPEPADVPAVAEAVDTDKMVRLIPSDWTVNSLSFPGLKAGDDDYVVTADAPANAPCLVPDSKADAVIAHAARHGFAIQKEALR